MANDLPEPASRKEQFLAKAAGENVELPTPASREELYLNAIANNGGGGGGGDAGLFLVRASETTSKSQTPEGSDLQQYAGQTGLYINDQYTNISAQGAGNIYYVYSIGEDPETGDAYAEYSLIANQQELWATVGNISDMMPIGGGGAPDSSTPGLMGQLYIDVAGSSLYVCIDDSNPYVWQQLGGGGGGDTVYSDKSTSDNATGGAVYIGNLDANQDEQPDPTTTDRNWKYFWALPYSNSTTPSNNSINILGSITSGGVNMAIGAEATARGNQSVALGYRAQTVQSSLAIGAQSNAGNGDTNRIGVTAIGYSAVARADYSIAIGGSTGNSYGVFNTNSTGSITIGKNAQVGNGSNGYKNSIALGSYSQPTRQGEVNVGLVTGETTGGYNSTAYRVIGGVHDGQTDHDAVTVGQINALIDAINSATSSNISHIGS